MRSVAVRWIAALFMAPLLVLGTFGGTTVLAHDHAEPNRWHTHAEVPSPLPDGSLPWIEIENGAGETSVGCVDLKM
jgi:hypothetical protein